MRGRDIKRYSYSFENQYIIALFPCLNYDIDDYPAIKSYLLSFGKERLEQTGKTYIINNERVQSRKKTNNKWFETQDSISYWDDFSKQKIIWGEISDKPKFALDTTGKYYASNTVFFMTGDNLEYLIAFLNSKLSEYYFSQIATTTGVGTVRWLKYKIDLLPIPTISKISTADINELKKLIQDGEKNTYEINKIIYKFYSLNDEEIALISSFDKP